VDAQAPPDRRTAVQTTVFEVEAEPPARVN
jgi:hypothetical protein